MTYTPWGASQTADQLADGIMDYTTASHGGIHLSVKRQAELWERLNLPVTPLSEPGPELSAWYEEDCDWAIPYAFLLGPTAEHYDDAKRTLLNWHPGAYLRLMGGSIAVEQSFIMRNDRDHGRDPFTHYTECGICRYLDRPTVAEPLVTFA